MNGHRLYRSERERMFGGVAGGLAEYFDLDPALVRVAWAVLIIGSGGLFLLLYIVMWFVVPEAPPGYVSGSPWSSSPPQTDAAAAGPAPASEAPASPSGPASSAPTGSQPSSIAGDWAARGAERRRRRSGEGGILVGAVLIVIGIWFLVHDYVPWLRSAELWPLALILIGLVLLVGALRRSPN
jgi:phage shock protein C